jgi:glycosyltransferase involved in cell wall biosynthesis
MGGVETYFRNLLKSLQEVDTVNDYLLVCNRRHLDSFSLRNNHFRHASSCYTKPSPLWYLRVALNNVTGIDLLRPAMNRLKADIIHHPFSFLNPMDLRIPSVLTFIDMQHELFPDYFSPRALRFRKKQYRPSTEQATRIITLSEHAKSALVERYATPPEKIDVIHIGYDPQFCRIGDADILTSARRTYGLTKPFIYYPAATWPHKNHLRLLAALRIMKERYAFDGQLVLSGIAMQTNNSVLREVERLGLQEDVVLLGYLPHEALPCLYNLARLMVFPSLYEGFGIPLVEAMASGCPIACSTVTSIPEVVDTAAVTFDPLSVEEMAETIWKIWNDDTLRRELQVKGVQRAKQFSWKNMAEQTIQVYRKSLGS